MRKALTLGLVFLLPVGLTSCLSKNTNQASSTQSMVIQAQQELNEAQLAVANAANYQISPWEYVGTSVGNLKYYVNTKSIKTHNQYEALDYGNGNIDFASSHTQAWWKIVSPTGEYTQTQTYFYCNKDASKDISSVRYSSSDEFINNNNVSRLVSHVIPNTVFSEISNIVCNLSR